MPMSGAIFLTNGRKRRHNKGRKSSPHGRLVARFNRGRKRRNGLAIRTNSRKRTGHRRRRNGLAIRTNGRKRHGRRRNGLAVRTNGRKRYGRRRNGLAIRINGRKRYGRRRNSGSSGMSASVVFSPVQKLLAMIPGGKKIAPYVAPVAYGALGLLGVHLALKYGAKYIPAKIASYVSPFGYTLGGILLGVVVQFLPIAKADKQKLAAAMVVGGAGVDTFRKLTGNTTLGDGEMGAAMVIPGYGEGGLWQLGDGGDGMGDPDSSALMGEYADAEMADAHYSGADLDSVEGEAALAGPREWRRRFPGRRRAAGAKGQCSRHAGQHGHRWAWLCRLVGFEKFRAIVALPADQRVAYIAQLRRHAISSIPSGNAGIAMNTVSAGGNGEGGLADLGATLYSGPAGAAY